MSVHSLLPHLWHVRLNVLQTVPQTVTHNLSEKYTLISITTKNLLDVKMNGVTAVIAENCFMLLRPASDMSPWYPVPTSNVPDKKTGGSIKFDQGNISPTTANWNVLKRLAKNIFLSLTQDYSIGHKTPVHLDLRKNRNSSIYAANAARKMIVASNKQITTIKKFKVYKTELYFHDN